MIQAVRRTLAALVLLGCWPSFSSAATRDHIQTDYGGVASGVGLAFSSNNTAGNTLVVYCVCDASTTLPTIADTRGNTYVLADSHAANTRGDHVWIATNCAAGANTVTCTLAGQTFELIISEFEGAHEKDVAVSANANSTDPTSGATATTTQADELVLGFNSNNAAGTTAGAGFTLRGSGVNNVYVRSESKVVSATGAQTATFTNASSGSWSCICVTLKAASAPAGGGVLVIIMQLFQ